MIICTFLYNFAAYSELTITRDYHEKKIICISSVDMLHDP